MCDIYYHRCNERGCETSIDMHLEDFSTERDEIEVFCEKHIPKDLSGGILFLMDDEDAKGPVFVRSLTANAARHSLGNLPNCECRIVVNGLTSKKKSRKRK